MLLDFKSNFRDTNANRNWLQELAIYSQPFYMDQYGYKLRIKAYLDGRDRGKGTHLSLYLSIMKGEYNAILEYGVLVEYNTLLGSKLFNQKT